MGGAYEYEEIGRSKRLERRRAAVGLGAFFVVVGTLGWNRKSLGAGAPASARGASRRQAPSASPREVGSAKPWQADAAAFPSNLRLSVSYYGEPPSLPLYGIAALAEPCGGHRGLRRPRWRPWAAATIVEARPLALDLQLHYPNSRGVFFVVLWAVFPRHIHPPRPAAF